MKWQLKAGLQNIFSFLPSGENLNYLFQKKVTKSLPVNESDLREILLFGKQHIANFQK